MRTSNQRVCRQGRKPMRFLLRIAMVELAPPIWPLIRVPDQFTLHQLHRVLQIIFSDLDYHLYAFQFGLRQFEAPGHQSGAENATSIRLIDLALSAGSQLTYLYDFGDGREHHIVVEAVLPVPSENGPAGRLGFSVVNEPHRRKTPAGRQRSWECWRR